MSKFLMGAAAAAILMGVSAANAQTQNSPAATQSQMTNPDGSKVIIDERAPAATVGSSRATEYPPEGQEGTKRPGQTAPKGNPGAAPVAR